MGKPAVVIQRVTVKVIGVGIHNAAVLFQDLFIVMSVSII